MSNQNEVEVKFLLGDRNAFEERLIKMGIPLWQERVLEINLRFDTPDGSLRAEKKVLRLRQDYTTYFTFKGPAQAGQQASIRQEIEVDVDDFATARAFLEALGYVVVVEYEKYRTGYKWGEILITLDEMPFGSFTELEGPDTASLQGAAAQLGLNWQARSLESYIGLFETVRQKRSLPARNLTFSEFEGVTVSPADLGLVPADLF